MNNLRKKLFHIFCFFMVLTCTILGVWQVERLQWKESLITQVEKYKNEKPEDFEILNFNQEQDLFKKVNIYGAFLHDYEILLSAKYLNESNDKSVLGYHIITPFLLVTGETIFVNRGWIPENLKEKSSRKKSLSDAFIEKPLKVMIRESHGKAPWYMPTNVPQKDIWFWIDLERMKNRLSEKSDLKNIKT
ncbi:MAG: SURF1 family protein, partial [Rickettsiales bacterium]|nr:SURF1 family protein [Rickettsiales bacterium]